MGWYFGRNKFHSLKTLGLEVEVEWLLRVPDADDVVVVVVDWSEMIAQSLQTLDGSSSMYIWVSV